MGGTASRARQHGRPRGLPAWARWSLVVAWTLFVWSRSLFSGPESSEQSALVVALVRPLFLALGVADVELMTLLVRKAAHFAEYFVLGLLLSLTRRRLSGMPWGQLAYGVAVPCADESIQLLVPGRSAMPTDVLIDSCGMATGLALGSLLRRRRSHARRAHR